MSHQPDFPLRIFYDGSCVVCSTEIEHYLRQNHGGRLVAVDIHAPDFDPAQYHISLDDFMYELHAIDQSGRIYRGVESFWAIWQAFPASTLYGIMATVIDMPVINPVARLLYKAFAGIRPWLPKRHDCTSGTCDISKRHSSHKKELP
jgi:predicted DCC family thiol-disulfide oxidoreductase YuxK